MLTEFSKYLIMPKLHGRLLIILFFALCQIVDYRWVASTSDKRVYAYLNPKVYYFLAYRITVRDRVDSCGPRFL